VGSISSSWYCVYFLWGSHTNIHRSFPLGSSVLGQCVTNRNTARSLCDLVIAGHQGGPFRALRKLRAGPAKGTPAWSKRYFTQNHLRPFCTAGAELISSSERLEMSLNPSADAVLPIAFVSWGRVAPVGAGANQFCRFERFSWLPVR